MQNPAPQPAAVIQGASRGIGFALTNALLHNPAYGRVIATCRSPAAASELLRLQEQSDGRLQVVALDVTDEVSIRQAAETVQDATDSVSLLINCAGVLQTGDIRPERRLDDLNLSHLREVFAVNAFGPLLVARYFRHLFPRSARSVLANISARVGSIGDNGLGGWYSYRGSKAAQNMFTRNLSIELRRRHRGLICVAVHPGTVDTDLSRPFQHGVPAGQLFPVERAATQLLGVLDGLEADQNGGFYAWDGSTIEW